MPKIARLGKLRFDEHDVIMDQKYCWQKLKKEIRTQKNVTNESKQLDDCKQLSLQGNCKLQEVSLYDVNETSNEILDHVYHLAMQFEINSTITAPLSLAHSMTSS